MKVLLMDVGNSHLKWATLDAGLLSKQQSLPYKDKPPIDLFEQVLDITRTDCDALIMVSVLGDAFLKAAEKTSVDKNLTFKNVHSQTQLAGIKNAYDEPHKLGADRLVAMIAAYNLSCDSQGKPQGCIVIDTGTATTIDAVDSDGQHLGGVILPGLDLCSENLLKNTELLPLWNKDSDEFSVDFLSKETSQAIASGCLLGLAGGIDSICTKMEQELRHRSDDKDIHINKVICGGATSKILPYLQLDYKHQQHLLMIGLQVIKEESC